VKTALSDHAVEGGHLTQLDLILRMWLLI